MRLKYASGLFNTMRNLGAAVGIAANGTNFNDHTNFHHQAIAAHLTPANGAMTQLVDGTAVRYGYTSGNAQAAHVAALKQLWHFAYRAASTMAYAKAFWVIMVAFTIATILIPLMHNVATPKARTFAAH